MAARADRQADRRRQILAEAVKVFARSGFHGARVGDIAVREVEGSGVGASEQVRQVTALLLRTWRRDPDLVRVLVREVTRSPHVQQEIEEITEAMKALERIIERGQEMSEFRPQIDPRLAAVIFYGALDEILTGWVLGQLPDTDEDIAHAESNVVQLLVEGMRAT